MMMSPQQQNNLSKIIDILISEDTQKFFTTSQPLSKPLQPSTSPTSSQPKQYLDFTQIKSKIHDGEYKNASKFYNDVQSCLESVVKRLEPKAQGVVDSSAKRLRQMCLSLLDSSFSAQSASSSPPENVERKKTPEKKVRRFAIGQKGHDGSFYFTSAATEAVIDSQIPTANEDLIKVEIFPSFTLSGNEIPTLGQVLNIDYSRPLRPERKPHHQLVKAESQEYNPFASFAPTSNTALSSLSYPESLRLLPSRKRTRCQDMSSRQDALNTKTTSEQMDTDGDGEGYGENGTGYENMGIIGGGDVNIVDVALEENRELLNELETLQRKRMKKGAGYVASHQELIRAARLKRSLGTMMEMAGNVDAIGKDRVAAAADALVMFDNAYKGTLPPSKPYAFKLNSTF
ncbi:hypothetical protein HDU76_002946 [Blyttiomyces sp. JEL0837]|nr:hypothetical protein HDU76_002946 [Blyttiomyces sp. JEL0837]